MKDIAALCKRVVVITDGAIKFDGSLAGVIDSFSGSKLIRFHLAEGQSAEGLEKFAEVESVELPRVTMRCQRSEVTKMLASILQQYEVEDVAVEDPPLEEVIADLYANGSMAEQTARLEPSQESVE